MKGDSPCTPSILLSHIYCFTSGTKQLKARSSDQISTPSTDSESLPACAESNNQPSSSKVQLYSLYCCTAEDVDGHTPTTNNTKTHDEAQTLHREVQLFAINNPITDEDSTTVDVDVKTGLKVFYIGTCFCSRTKILKTYSLTIKSPLFLTHPRQIQPLH